jgi:polar amino acid transport system permease protein
VSNTYFVGLSFQSLLFLLEGAGRTLLLGFCAGFFGTLLGLTIGWLRFQSRIAAAVLAPYVDICRSVPLLIQIILVNALLGVFGVYWNAFTTGLLVLALYAGAYFSEVFRAGLHSVPIATIRAGRALGLNGLQNLAHVVMPIATRVAFPGWVNIFLGTLKDTSLVAVIGYVELLHATQILITQTQQALIVLLGSGAVYFIMCAVISSLSRRFEIGIPK